MLNTEREAGMETSNAFVGRTKQPTEKAVSAALAIDRQKTRKAALDERQSKIDKDLAEQRALGCPAG